MVETVLAYIRINHRILMLFRNKKKVDINKGKWIGIGGHLEEGETKDEALIREIKEETGLTVKNYSYRGELLFINDDFQEIMYLYLVDEVEGSLIDCDEGELRWFNEDEIMSLNMWEGDKVFLPRLLTTDEFIKLKLIYKDDKYIGSFNWEGE